MYTTTPIDPALMTGERHLYAGMITVLVAGGTALMTTFWVKAPSFEAAYDYAKTLAAATFPNSSDRASIVLIPIPLYALLPEEEHREEE